MAALRISAKSQHQHQHRSQTPSRAVLNAMLCGEGKTLDRECREAAACSQLWGLRNPKSRYQHDPQRTKSCSEVILIFSSYKVHPFRTAPSIPCPPTYALTWQRGRERQLLPGVEEAQNELMFASSCCGALKNKQQMGRRFLPQQPTPNNL